MNLDRIKKSKKILTDSALIIFSVLFALFINECKSNVSEKKETQKLLANIEVEISNNQAILKGLRTYHKEVLENIHDVYKKDSLEATFFPGNFFLFNKVASNGVIQQSLTNIAWEIGKQNNISSRIDFDKSLLLFEAYEQQRVVNETIDLIVNNLSSREILRKDLLEESVFLIGGQFNELTGQEGVLLQDYENALNALKEK